MAHDHDVEVAAASRRHRLHRMRDGMRGFQGGNNADLMAALHTVLRHRIKRLPVIDDEGELVGLLGRGNLLRGLANEE